MASTYSEAARSSILCSNGVRCTRKCFPRRSCAPPPRARASAEDGPEELDTERLWERTGVVFQCSRISSDPSAKRLFKRLGIKASLNSKAKAERLSAHPEVDFSSNYIRALSSPRNVQLAWLPPEHSAGPSAFAFTRSHIFAIEDILAPGAIESATDGAIDQEMLYNGVVSACEESEELDHTLQALLESNEDTYGAEPPPGSTSGSAGVEDREDEENEPEVVTMSGSELDEYLNGDRSLMYDAIPMAIPSAHKNLCNDLLGPEDNILYLAWQSGHLLRADSKGMHDEACMDALDLGPSNGKQMLFADLWRNAYISELTDFAKAGVSFDYSGAITTRAGNWRSRTGSGGRKFLQSEHEQAGDDGLSNGDRELSDTQSLQEFFGSEGDDDVTDDEVRQDEKEGGEAKRGDAGAETEGVLSAGGVVVEEPEYPIDMELLERDIVYDSALMDELMRDWILNRVYDAEGELMYAVDPKTDELKPRTEVESDVRLASPEGEEISRVNGSPKARSRPGEVEVDELTKTQEENRRSPFDPISEKINYSPTDYVVNEPLKNYDLNPPSEQEKEELPLEAFVPRPPPEPETPELPSTVPFERDSYHVVRLENWDYFIRREEGLQLDLSDMFAVERVERPSMPVLPDQYTGVWKDVSLKGMSVAAYREIDNTDEVQEDEMSSYIDREQTDDIMPYNVYSVTKNVYLIKSKSRPEYEYTEEHGWLEKSGATDRDLDFNEIVRLDGYEPRAERCEVEGDPDDQSAVLEIRDDKLYMMPQAVMNFPLAYADELNAEREDSGGDAKLADDFTMEDMSESDEEFESPESEL